MPILTGVKKLLLLVLLICIALCLMSTAAPEYTLCCTENGESVFCHDYRMSFLNSLRLTFLYNSSFSDYYESNAKRGIYAMDIFGNDAVSDLSAFLSDKRVSAMDATIAWDGNDFAYTAEKFGKAIDEQALVESLLRLETFDRTAEIEYLPITPAITKADLSVATCKVAMFSTSFASSADARKHNIRLAARALDGVTIPAGGVLSFNATVGERTAARGYREANIIINGEFVKGIGGGVCQVSTTLYNAALRAGLDAQSASHSLPVSYVPMGFDAMVSSACDLRLCNNTPFPFYLSVKTKGDKVSATFYSKQTEDSLSFSSVTEKIIPATNEILAEDNLSPDETFEETVLKQKKDGAIVTTYVTRTAQNGYAQKIKLRTSYYKPQNGIVKRTPTPSPEMIEEEKPTSP